MSGGTVGPAHTWSVVSPSWLTVTNTSGSTTKLTSTGPLPAPGPVQVILRVERDPSASNDSMEFVELMLDAHVGPRLAITTTVLPEAYLGVPYNETVSAFGGTGAYVWSVAFFQPLPPGFALGNATASDATLSGTPTTLGLYQFWLEVSDGQTTLVQAYTVEVMPPPSVLGSRKSSPSSCAVGPACTLSPLAMLFLFCRRRLRRSDFKRQRGGRQGGG